MPPHARRTARIKSKARDKESWWLCRETGPLLQGWWACMTAADRVLGSWKQTVATGPRIPPLGITAQESMSTNAHGSLTRA